MGAPPKRCQRRPAVNWLDLVLIVVLALAALHGLRVGATMQILSFGGMILGLFLGALLVPVFIGLAHSTIAKVILTEGMVFGGALVVGTIGRVIGAHIRPWIRRFGLGIIDSGIGMVVGIVATLVVIWLVAGLVVNANIPVLSRAVERSRILKTVDTILPPAPEWVAHLRSFLNTQGFPEVFTGVSPIDAGPVKLPSNTLVRDAVEHDGRSIVKISSVGCGELIDGSGFVVAPHLVVTNAHVIAGTSHTEVLSDYGRIPHHAYAIYYNPRLDIAVLKVPTLDDPPLPLLDSLVHRGLQGAVIGYPGGGPFTAVPAGVMEEFEAQGRDIYNQGLVDRQVYEIDAVVRPGNSGGPLAEPDGVVVGVVFSRSVTNPNVGFALAMPAVIHDIHIAESSSETPVSTGACMS